MFVSPWRICSHPGYQVSLTVPAPQLHYQQYVHGNQQHSSAVNTDAGHSKPPPAKRAAAKQSQAPHIRALACLNMHRVLAVTSDSVIYDVDLISSNAFAAVPTSYADHATPMDVDSSSESKHVDHLHAPSHGMQSQWIPLFRDARGPVPATSLTVSPDGALFAVGTSKGDVIVACIPPSHASPPPPHITAGGWSIDVSALQGVSPSLPISPTANAATPNIEYEQCSGERIG